MSRYFAGGGGNGASDPELAALIRQDTSETAAALRAASVAAVEAEAAVSPTGVWDFSTAPTVGGAPIGVEAGPGVLRVEKITAAAYAALGGSVVATTLYVIVG